MQCKAEIVIVYRWSSQGTVGDLQETEVSHFSSRKRRGKTTINLHGLQATFNVTTTLHSKPAAIEMLAIKHAYTCCHLVKREFILFYNKRQKLRESQGKSITFFILFLYLLTTRHIHPLKSSLVSFGGEISAIACYTCITK